MRIPGLASGMDIDSMVSDMLVKEKEKVDQAKQDQQVTKWKQEIYKDVIKDTKNLYDKYFSMTSSNSLLSSSSYSNMGISSSNSNVITATAGPGAEKVNYKFNVISKAEPPKVDFEFDESMQGKKFEISTKDKDGKNLTIEIEVGSDVKGTVDNINKALKDTNIKASYSEMTGKIKIQGSETGKNSTFSIDGNLKQGKDLNIEVTDLSNPTNKVNNITGSSNTFTIDNIKYDVNSTGESTLASISDTKKAVENMQAFVKDYNKLMDKMYDIITEKKPKDFKPLTEEQKKEMSEEEIKKWEEKAKAGILKNDSDMRRFMDDIQNVIFGSLESSGISLSEIGITSSEDYNKKNQISFNSEKFSKALEDKGDQVYKALAGGVNGQASMFDKMKDTLYKYSGSSTSIFAKKAGMGGSSEDNNMFANDIRKQETKIKDLVKKMENKEQQLYSKFAALESVLNKYNSQMGYFMQSMV